MVNEIINESRNKTIRVLIVDDHPSFGHGLRALVNAVADDIEVIAVATTLETALKEIRKDAPDVMIMDLRLPEGDELDFMRRVRRDLPETKLLVLTGAVDAGKARDALALGAQGFLFKDVEVEDLVASIRVVDAGGTVLSPTVMDAVLATPAADVGAVTAAEIEVLRLVAEGFDNQQIANRLAVSESTLKRNLRVIEDKLGARNRVHAAVQAAKLGLI